MHWNNVFLCCLLKTRLDFAIRATRSVQFRVWGDARVGRDQNVGTFVWWVMRAGTTRCSVLSSTVCRHRWAPGRHGPLSRGHPIRSHVASSSRLAFLQHKPMTWDPLLLGALKHFTASLAEEGPSCQSLPLERGSGRGFYAAAKPRAWWGKALLPSQEPLFLLRI